MGADSRPAEWRSLRILQVVDSVYPGKIGGAELQARLISRALATAGHSVRVVSPRLDKTMAVNEMIDDVPVTRLAYPRVKWLGALCLCARFGFWLWRRRHDFDAIHIHIAKNLAAVAGLLRPGLDARVMVKISGAWEFDGGILDHRLRKRPAHRLYNWCIRRVDHIQCISEHTRRVVEQAGYSATSVCMIPNAVDLVRFDPPVRPVRQSAACRVVYVGRIRTVKGLTVLIKAWSKIVRELDAHLTVAGSGPQLEALMQLTRESGLDGTVDFPGHVTDVPSVLANADIYVQPSFQEGLPNSVLEAMAMALPIVATRISGNEDVVVHEENGLLVPPGDPEALAVALRTLITDPNLVHRMGRRSHELVAERFSLAAVIRRLERVYQGTTHPASEPARLTF
jgi:glycosyltransferase involved in cell wall biosynthesis